ncbi:hypothetical protein SG34_001690 [Thalassomonas viridans]|uniref:Uncharacterized protein n=1 Tax=Thalassomonas viridans TaxID=137584 RepID=A0AAE9Z2P4_9GAMM|nr:hypothetical protein [Thalassomonas viridans]WDE05681.1 hypothetical protein SG34_001690 [Thalassomonas viridans]
MRFALKNGLCLLPVTLLLMACQTSEPAPAEMASSSGKVAASKQGGNVSNKLIKQERRPVQEWQHGTVKYLTMEGGFYGIVTDEGKKLLPMGLAAEYRQHGAKVRVKGELIKDMMTIQQWGTPFKITEIELLAPGLKHPPGQAER